MKKWYDNRIQSAISGKNPMVIAELDGGYVAFGDVQFLPGYCVLLPKKNVSSINDLSIKERMLFLKDMTLVGDALLSICGAKRINYDILGNTDDFLHAHIFPRYTTEKPERLEKPVWLYDSEMWSNVKYQYNPKKDNQLREKIADYLLNLPKGKMK